MPITFLKHFGWMLLLGAVMATEKNVSWGHRLRKPIGVTLLVAALGVGVWNIA
jgi:predicted metal-binding membrane protein